jgi:hypothetical protein
MEAATLLELLRFIKAHQHLLHQTQQLEQLSLKLDEVCAYLETVMRSQPAADSPVAVQRYANGNVEISVTGKHGTMMLTVNPEEPRILLRDPEREARCGRRYKFVCGLEANSELHGWFVSEAHDPPGYDEISWIPAKKKRAPKRPPKNKRDA